MTTDRSFKLITAAILTIVAWLALACTALAEDTFWWGFGDADTASVTLYSSKPTTNANCRVNTTYYNIVSVYSQNSNATFDISPQNGNDVAELEVKNDYGVIMRGVKGLGTGSYKLSMSINGVEVCSKTLVLTMKSGSELPMALVLSKTIYHMDSDIVTISYPTAVGAAMPQGMSFSLQFANGGTYYPYFRIRNTEQGVAVTKAEDYDAIPDGVYRFEMYTNLGNVSYPTDTCDICIIVGDISENIYTHPDGEFKKFSSTRMFYTGSESKVCECTVLVESKTYDWAIMNANENAVVLTLTPEANSCKVDCGGPMQLTPGTFTYTLRCTVDNGAFYETEIALSVSDWDAEEIDIDFGDLKSTYKLPIADGASVKVPAPELEIKGVATTDNAKYRTYIDNGIYIDYQNINGEYVFFSNPEFMSAGTRYKIDICAKYYNVYVSKTIKIEYGDCAQPTILTLDSLNYAGARAGTDMELYDPISADQSAGYTIYDRYMIGELSASFDTENYTITPSIELTQGADVVGLSLTPVGKWVGGFSCNILVDKIKSNGTGHYLFKFEMEDRMTYDVEYVVQKEFSITVKSASDMPESISFSKTNFKGIKTAMKVPYPTGDGGKQLPHPGHGLFISASGIPFWAYVTMSDFLEIMMNNNVTKGLFRIPIAAQFGNLVYDQAVIKIYVGIGDITQDEVSNTTDDINESDVVLALEGLTGKRELTAEQKSEADVNIDGNGTYDNKDMVTLLQYINE